MNLQRLDAPPTELEREALRRALAREADEPRDKRRAHGVVHTPLPLVRHALHSVHTLLQAELALADGLRSEQLTVLDPALGTGTWLASLLAITGSTRASLLGLEADPGVADAARELLAPHGVRVRCTNTLAEPAPFAEVNRVRLIVGNPPWGARSLSKGLSLSDAWLRRFHHDADGQPLRERRAGVLSDDYVRFFSWALEQALQGQGGAVVCFVTNSSYLDGPVHRGMRAALLGAFDQIEVLDLGGNALLSQGDAPDQSLFAIRVGAALTVCVRRPGGHARRAQVDHAQLSGRRAQKLAALSQPIARRTFIPAAPFFRFRAQSADAGVAAFSLHEAFRFHAEGVQTNRDALVTAPSREALYARLERIADGTQALPRSRHLDPDSARAAAERALRDPQAIAQLAYRPFETRLFCSLTPLCHRPRPRLGEAVRNSTLSLLCVRKEPGQAAWNMFAAARAIADSSYLSVRSSCRTRAFPSHHPDGADNLTHPIRDALSTRLGLSVDAAQLLLYTLGVLGSPRYRREHAAALKHDYPRIPWPYDADGWRASCAAGSRFVRVLLEPAPHVDVALTGGMNLDALVCRQQLRWLAPHQIELDPGTQIGAGNLQSMQARVGHYPIVESIFAGGAEVTIRAVMQACQRAVMWGEAEKAADCAYRPANSVRPNANGIAVID